MLRRLLDLVLSFVSALLSGRRGAKGAGAPRGLPISEADRKRFAASEDAAQPIAQDAVFHRSAPSSNASQECRVLAEFGHAEADYALPQGDVTPGPAVPDECAKSLEEPSSRRSTRSLGSDADRSKGEAESGLPATNAPQGHLDDTQPHFGADDLGPAPSAIFTMEPSLDPISDCGTAPQTDSALPCPQTEPEEGGGIGAIETATAPATTQPKCGGAKGGSESAPDEPQDDQAVDPPSEPEAGMTLPPPEDLDVLSGGGDQETLLSVGEDTQRATVETGAGEAPPRPPPVRPATKYRPQLRHAARTSARAPAGAPVNSLQVLEADFLLCFHPGNWGFDVAALLKRPPGSPEQLEVSDGGEALALTSIDDVMLEPLRISDLAASLAHGFAAETASGAQLRWVRTGRRLHVFSERSGVPGFATVPRIIIGQENVALCSREFAPSALEQIIATGSPQPSEVEGPGLPAGWVCWKGIWPARPHPPASADELLGALDPRPHAAIELAGGMTAARGQWLEGHPPAIRIAGTAAVAGEVTIDGAPAAAAADGGFTAEGWDSQGVHQVEFRGIRRSYAIVRAAESWPWWPAHRSGIELAGALGLATGHRAPLILADPSIWLLGARPGEVSRAVHRPGAPGGYHAPGFEPVWAIARKSGRRRPQPALIGMAVPPQPTAPESRGSSIRVWSQLIRDGGIPGGPLDGSEAAIWRQFVAAARSVRRQRR